MSDFLQSLISILNSGMGFRFPKFRNSGIAKFQNNRDIPKSRNPGIAKLRNSEISESQNTGIAKSRNREIPELLNPRIAKYRKREIPKFRYRLIVFYCRTLDSRVAAIFRRPDSSIKKRQFFTRNTE